eukprot:COSAG05_NODE_5443_length_1173_cov_1.249534_1_plen_295_part_01
MTMTAEQTTATLKMLRLHHAPPRQQKIDHVVVLMLENRAFDHLLGCMAADKPGVDGIPASGRVLTNGRHHHGGASAVVNLSCGTAEYVCKGAHWSYDQIWKPKVAPGSDPSRFPYNATGAQSDAWAVANGGMSSEGGRLFNGSQLPVKRAILEEFGLFNRWFSSVPSASSPNHFFAQSATSCGIHDNVMYSECGGSTNVFPQLTIWDSLFLHNVSFSLYMNSTCGVDGKPCHSVDPNSPYAGSPLRPTAMPDVAMSGVGRHKRRFQSQERFYADAAAGSLPGLSWLMPPTEASDH